MFIIERLIIEAFGRLNLSSRPLVGSFIIEAFGRLNLALASDSTLSVRAICVAFRPSGQHKNDTPPLWSVVILIVKNGILWKYDNQMVHVYVYGLVNGYQMGLYICLSRILYMWSIKPVNSPTISIVDPLQF